MSHLKAMSRSKLTRAIALLLVLYFAFVSLHTIDSPIDSIESTSLPHRNTFSAVIAAFASAVTWDVAQELLPPDLSPEIEMAMETTDRAESWKYDFSREGRRVQIPEFYYDFTQPSPRVQSYDPRFLWGIYLRHITNQLETHAPPSIPFVWSEWVDLSPLDEFITLPEDQKPTCGDVKDKAEFVDYRKMLARVEEAKHDGTESETDRKARLIEEFRMPYCVNTFGEPSSPGFQIVEPTLETSTARIKALHAMSYLLGPAPAPELIVFLLRNGAVVVGLEKGNPLHVNHTLVELYMELGTTVVDVKADIEALRKAVKGGKALAKRKNSGNQAETRRAEPRGTGQEAVEKIDLEAALLPYMHPLSISSFLEDCYLPLFSFVAAKPPHTRTPLERNYIDSIEKSIEAKATEQIPKYFSETPLTGTTIGAHYDWRFFSGLTHQNLAEQRIVLHHMLRTWLKFTGEFGFTTWLAHGSLLSWYWNGLSFPWDNDMDVQMSLEALHAMTLQFNQSLVVGLDESYDNYLLDVGTYITERSPGNGKNSIDARFIHTGTGLYIDITGIALTSATPGLLYTKYLEDQWVELGLPGSYAEVVPEQRLDAHTKMNMLNDRKGHCIALEHLTPLRQTIVEGTPAYIPRGFQRVLENEYMGGLTRKEFDNYVYMPQLRNWISRKAFDWYPDMDELSDEAIRVMLQENVEILDEMYATHVLTRLHEHEMKELTEDEWGSEKLIGTNQGIGSMRHDLFEYRERLAGKDEERAAEVRLVY
ncbi:hypothetical protein BABINDRAFT_168748 [Babjeviella inositovora NRRL Y-12698]|uniref:LicD/FKTN/FKRP nucleotidyltransferase domain-containing protein n=1 Tax=Babjeviella inositovora NRRL Y-12698 TaxID=984486 RepID=A0A1E3QLC1_9ASCO|nr:uncharacterized protein BABINDRAFT_168748 [Babjeviella inositovora NRRL Y-12698]ODQ77787.1 hypothetical protein BABINDRAFT_168748 [Babjeviella inositovora NRRL Y-12698]